MGCLTKQWDLEFLGWSTEKAMAPYSSTLAWKIPWMEEPGGLQSMLRVGHNWATSLSLFTFMHRRRKWQPTPVFLPGESQGRRSVVGCHLWGRRVGHDWSDLAAAGWSKDVSWITSHRHRTWTCVCLYTHRHTHTEPRGAGPLPIPAG